MAEKFITLNNLTRYNTKLKDIELAKKANLTDGNEFTGEQVFSNTINSTTNEVIINTVDSPTDLIKCKDATNDDTYTVIGKDYFWVQLHDGDSASFRNSKLSSIGITFSKETNEEVDYNGTLLFPTDLGASGATKTIATTDNVAAKMDKTNPAGTGTFSLNRKADTTIGDYSFAEGYDTTASGLYSHAEGDYSRASGASSHAEGEGSTASGGCAHAEGQFTTASGYFSHAEGQYTGANGLYSHAEGYSTIANRKSQHVFGENNIIDSSTETVSERGNYVEIVGNGTNNNRSNARTLDWTGNEWLAGSLTTKALKTTIASSEQSPAITLTTDNNSTVNIWANSWGTERSQHTVAFDCNIYSGYNLNIEGNVEVDGYINTDGNLTAGGTLTATIIKKKDGTASQFLKADGSVDSNAYITLNKYTYSATITASSTDVNKRVYNIITQAKGGVYDKYNVFNISDNDRVSITYISPSSAPSLYIRKITLLSDGSVIGSSAKIEYSSGNLTLTGSSSETASSIYLTYWNDVEITE